MSDDIRSPGHGGGLGLAEMRVWANTPDGTASAELVGHELALSFAPGAYYRSDERALERAGEQLCRVLWKGYAQQFNELITRSGGTAMNLQTAAHPLDMEFAQRLAQIRAHGSSPDGRVTIEAIGMRDWTVHIADGTVAALSEEEFAAAAGHAARSLIEDQLIKVALLKHDIYRPR
jgi:hypothetical protein